MAYYKIEELWILYCVYCWNDTISGEKLLYQYIIKKYNMNYVLFDVYV